jgi:hypothetical protein
LAGGQRQFGFLACLEPFQGNRYLTPSIPAAAVIKP